MVRLADALAIALWIVGSCWVLAILAYAFGGPPKLILLIFVLGVVTGVAEWAYRRSKR
jgi:hypothetical protein